MITLYKMKNCPHCVATTDYLARNDIEFREVDVMENDIALQFLRGRGHTKVPQLYVGDQLLVAGGNTGIQALTRDQINEAVRDVMNGACELEQCAA